MIKRSFLLEKVYFLRMDITRIFSVSSSFSNKNIYDNLIEMQILRACKSGPAGKWCVLEQRKRFVKYLSFILTYHRTYHVGEAASGTSLWHPTIRHCLLIIPILSNCYHILIVSIVLYQFILLNKAQRPTMRPHAFLGISSYRDARDERRKSENGNSHLWW